MGLNFPFGIQLNLEIDYEIEELRRRNASYLRARNLRDASNPFELPEDIFLKEFRLSRELTLELIQQIAPHFPATYRITAVPPYLKILAALNFYGQGSYQKGIGSNFHISMSQSMISKSISLVSRIIIDVLMPTVIKFPTSVEDTDRIKQGFINKFQFPGIIGCIDGTQIPIISPAVDDPVYPAIAYFNRKGYYSVNVQLICDSDLIITAVNARYPGATHDAVIWAMSVIKRNLENRYINGERNTWLLGDSGYPLQPWLFMPIVDAPANTPKGRYTAAHIRTRNSIERLNSVLKGRFRCLHKHRSLHYSPTKAGQIIYVCCILHNLCRLHNVPDDFEEYESSDSESDDEDVQEPFQNVPVNILADARRIRQQLIRNHFLN